MNIVKTENYIVYVNNGKITLAKSLKTGKFIKLSLAQGEYDLGVEAAPMTNDKVSYNFSILVMLCVIGAILSISGLINNEVFCMFYGLVIMLASIIAQGIVVINLPKKVSI